jgi:two-component system response regulator PilR (NtrC family)
MMNTRHNNRLLIADDDETLLFAFRKLFRNEDIQIDSASSVEEAKELIKNNHYDLVLSDLRFVNHTEGDGYEILSFVKQCDPETVTILWTAFCASLSKKRLEKYLVDYHFCKPIPLEEIRQVMVHIGLLSP